MDIHVIVSIFGSLRECVIGDILILSFAESGYSYLISCAKMSSQHISSACPLEGKLYPCFSTLPLFRPNYPLSNGGI